MNISGCVTSEHSMATLASLVDDPTRLESVSTLEDVAVRADGVVSARFTPSTALGRFVLAVTIRTVSRDERGARVRVTGRHGAFVVDVDLALLLAPGDGGTVLTWDADVLVRGAAASVGQRVARDIAQRAIADVLTESAQVAGQPA